MIITQENIIFCRKQIAKYEAQEKEYRSKAQTCQPRQRGAYLSHATQAAKSAKRWQKTLKYQLGQFQVQETQN